MAVDFLFENPTKEIPAIQKLKKLWQYIPDSDVQRQICYEHQYLEFHVWLLKNLRSTKAGCAPNPPYKTELGLSVRAGSIKAALLLCASIAEAALRAHAERRGFRLPKDLKRRTFGKVLDAWSINRTPHADLQPIWQELTELHIARNNVHLHKAAQDTNAYFEQVVLREQATFSKAKKVLKHLRTLQSP